jgi:hypothetical protein
VTAFFETIGASFFVVTAIFALGADGVDAEAAKTAEDWLSRNAANTKRRYTGKKPERGMEGNSCKGDWGQLFLILSQRK